MMIFFLIVILFSALIIFASFPQLGFFFLCRKNRFSLRESFIILNSIGSSNRRRSSEIFFEPSLFEGCIKNILLKFDTKKSGISEDLVLRLFKFRKQMEDDCSGIVTTRKISAGQKISVSLKGKTAFPSVVMENLRGYMAIAYPSGIKLPKDFLWRGHRINVYFKRGRDAGYFFETVVLSYERFEKKVLLYIGHSDELIRTQDRAEIRRAVGKEGELFIPPDQAVIKCEVLDISAGGVSVRVNGRGKAGIKAGIRTALGGIAGMIEFTGIVCAVNYNSKLNRSVLHMFYEPLPSDDLKIKILSYVYDLK